MEMDSGTVHLVDIILLDYCTLFCFQDPSKQSPVKAPTTSPAPSASFSPAQFGFGAAQKTTPTTEANQPNKSMASSIFGVGKQWVIQFVK